MRATSTDPAARPVAMTGKSPDAFRTISEVAEELDVPAHVLRFWESKFTQVHPIKRGGGRRYYRPEDVNLLKGIRDLLYKDGLTIKGVQKVLRDQGAKKVAATAAPVATDMPVAPEPVAAERPAPAAVPAPDPFPAAAQPALFPESADTVPLRLERKHAFAPAKPAGGEMAEIIRALEMLRDKMRG